MRAYFLTVYFNVHTENFFYKFDFLEVKYLLYY